MAHLRHKVGNHGENQIEIKLYEKLRHNYDRGTRHDNRAPDFSIRDDSGRTVSFVESKARMSPGGKANGHDISQTKDAISLAATNTSAKELNLVTPGGKKFFSSKHLQDLQSHARQEGVTLRIWDRNKLGIDRLIDHLKQVVQKASAAHRAELKTSEKSPTNQPNAPKADTTATKPAESKATAAPGSRPPPASATKPPSNPSTRGQGMKVVLPQGGAAASKMKISSAPTASPGGRMKVVASPQAATGTRMKVNVPAQGSAPSAAPRAVAPTSAPKASPGAQGHVHGPARSLRSTDTRHNDRACRRGTCTERT